MLGLRRIDVGRRIPGGVGAARVRARAGHRVRRTGGGRSLAASRVDTRSASSDTETATLAGGCFWGVQGVFEHVAGVLSAVSGYAGGAAGTAHYEQVGTGTTGHAESVEITFDPRTITYGQILQIFFSVVHDPTQLDRQGPDVGEQYRSTIFPVDDDQARVARAYIDQLEQARAFDGAIVTTIEPGRAFYPAEGYHQDFLERNPTYPYIVRNDLPKVAALGARVPGALSRRAGARRRRRPGGLTPAPLRSRSIPAVTTPDPDGGPSPGRAGRSSCSRTARSGVEAGAIDVPDVQTEADPTGDDVAHVRRGREVSDRGHQHEAVGRELLDGQRGRRPPPPEHRGAGPSGRSRRGWRCRPPRPRRCSP